MSIVAVRRYLFGLFWTAVSGVLVWQLVAGGTTAGPTPGSPTGPTVRTTDGAQGVGSYPLVISSGLFTIAGTAAKPISPGMRAPLDLRLTNPHDTALSVSDLKVTVRRVSAPHADGAHPCAIGDFAIDQVPAGLVITVPARAISKLSGLGVARAKLPHVGMLNRPVDQDGCKGASLTLAYAASGALDR